MSKGAAGAGATGVEAVSQAGSRQSVSPVLWSPAPGTMLTDGHEAPRSRRSPRPAALLDMLLPSFASSSFVLWAAKQLAFLTGRFVNQVKD